MKSFLIVAIPVILLIGILIASPILGILLIIGLWMLYDKFDPERIAKRDEFNNECKERLKRENNEWELQENKRIAHRDADFQTTPYQYECVGHPNRTLALRYGVVNQKKEVIEFWYYARGGEKKRNPEKDEIRYVPATTIRLKKNGKIKEDDTGTHFLASLPDYGDRNVRVVIQKNAEFIYTFYPINESWFKDHGDLEEVLKNNEAFDLKELANFHVQKVVRGK